MNFFIEKIEKNAGKLDMKIFFMSYNIINI